MKLFVLLLILLASFGATDSQSLSREGKLKQEVEMFEKQINDAFARKDRAALEQMIADDFTFIHSTGLMETRKEYLDSAAAGNLARQTSAVRRFDEQTRIYEGRTAVRYGRTVMRNENFEFRMRNIAVCVKVGDRWRWVSGQSTKLPSRPKSISINSKFYDLYAGQYEISANRFLTVAKEGEKLTAQVSGRPKLELIPKSDTEFTRFSEDNDYGNSEIVFAADAKAQTIHAAYRSDGEEIWRAKKIK